MTKEETKKFVEMANKLQTLMIFLDNMSISPFLELRRNKIKTELEKLRKFNRELKEWSDNRRKGR